MNLLDLMALYLLAGLVCTVAVWRRHRGSPRLWLSMCMSLLLWPLWAPFALMDKNTSHATRPRRKPTAVSAVSARLEAQLDKAVLAAEGTPFASMLGPAAAGRMSLELREASTRLAELDNLLQQPGFDRATALKRVDVLLQEAAGNPATAAQLRSARLHLDNVERLARLQLTQQRALSELEQAIFALHSQLLVARYAGADDEGVGAIVTDLWSRVEGLGAVLDPHRLAPDAPSAATSDTATTLHEAASTAPVDPRAMKQQPTSLNAAKDELSCPA